MKSVAFIAIAVMLLSACQHGPKPAQAPLVPGAIDLNVGRVIAGGSASHGSRLGASASALERVHVVRNRGNPTERELRCDGWGQCDKTRI